MSKKMILSALVTLAFSMNCFAAGMNKAEAGLRLNKEFAAEAKTIDAYKKSYDEAMAKGDMKLLNEKQKSEFKLAISTIAAKVGVDSTSLQRVVLIKSDVLVDMIRLDEITRSTTATSVEKDAARTQVELTNLIGKAMDKDNFKSTETKAAVKLLQLDLISLANTKAPTVVGEVNKQLREGKSLVDAVKEGTKGIKGTLEDLINCV